MLGKRPVKLESNNMTVAELVEKLNRLPQDLEAVRMPEGDADGSSPLMNVDTVYVEKDATTVENFWDEEDFEDISKNDPEFASTLRQVVVIWTQ